MNEQLIAMNDSAEGHVQSQNQFSNVYIVNKKSSDNGEQAQLKITSANFAQSQNKLEKLNSSDFN